MKKFLIFISFLLSITSISFAKTLETTHCTIDLDKYNVAILGNSHASFMSDFINVDNDINSLSVSNHGIAGDDLGSYGCPTRTTTDWKHGSYTIAEKGDCKGWLASFIDDIETTDYAICWFGSNSINHNIESFKKQYKDWLTKMRNKDEHCKLILMDIPYTNWENKLPYQTDEHIDEFNKAIKELAEEFKDKNVYYEQLPKDVTFCDRVHLDKASYTKIWNNLVKKYNIELKKIEDVDNTIKWKIDGWVKMNDKWYFYLNGQILINNFTPDGYYVGEDGSWIENYN